MFAGELERRTYIMMTNMQENKSKRFPISLVTVSMVIAVPALFVGTYLLSFSILTECLEEVPAWLVIPILAFDFLWVVLIRFLPISRRLRVISTLLVLTVSAAVLFTMLCVWGIPV